MLTFRFYKQYQLVIDCFSETWLHASTAVPAAGDNPMSDRDPIEIEQRFACQVANAQSYARLGNTAGFPQTAADQVCCALGELWEDGIKVGLSCSDVTAIAKKYVEYDEDGEAWPRPMGNVVPLGRQAPLFT